MMSDVSSWSSCCWRKILLSCIVYRVRVYCTPHTSHTCVSPGHVSSVSLSRQPATSSLVNGQNFWHPPIITASLCHFDAHCSLLCWVWSEVHQTSHTLSPTLVVSNLEGKLFVTYTQYITSVALFSMFAIDCALHRRVFDRT